MPIKSEKMLIIDKKSKPLNKNLISSLHANKKPVKGNKG